MPSENFIDDVINNTKYRFVEGIKNANKVRDKADKDETLKAKIRSSSYYSAMSDEYFAIDANRIPGTKMIASAGPTKKYAMPSFLREIVFNSHYSSDKPDETPIANIIALGEHVTREDSDRQDFHDYCLTEREKALYTNRKFRLPPEDKESPLIPNQMPEEGRFVADECYELSVKRINQEIYKGHDSVSTYLDSKGVVVKPTTSHWNGIAQSNLTLRMAKSEQGAKIENVSHYDERVDPDFQWQFGEAREVKVTLLGLRDNSPLKLNEENTPLFWELYQQTLKSPTVIHCASGIGRTGNLILTFEILRNYEAIFADNDASKAGNNILAIVNGIRKVRPALVNTKEQFAAAIRNAETLYRYGLGLGNKIEVDLVKMKEEFHKQYPEEKMEYTFDFDEDDFNIGAYGFVGNRYSSYSLGARAAAPVDDKKQQEFVNRFGRF